MAWTAYRRPNTPTTSSEAARPATFEETYPRYEFAEMVRIGLVLAEWLAAGAGWLAKAGRRVQRSDSPQVRQAGARRGAPRRVKGPAGRSREIRSAGT